MIKQDVIKEYLNTNRTMKEAAAVLVTSPASLCRFIKENGLPSKKSNWKGVAWNSGKTYEDDPRILAKESHPRYIDGRTYTSDFYRLRDKHLPDDCIICRESADTLHHIDHNKDNNREDNLIPICSSCHSTYHNKFRDSYRKLASGRDRRWDIIKGRTS